MLVWRLARKKEVFLAKSLTRVWKSPFNIACAEKTPSAPEEIANKNMKNRFTPLFAQALAVGAVAVLTQSAQSQTTLYDNTATYSGANFNYGVAGSTVSAGNEVVLNGTATSYAISQFQVQYDFTGSGTAAAVVDASFYANTGAPFNGYATPAASTLWDAGNFTLSAFTTGAGNTLTYTVPNTVVPKDFTWVVTFSGLAAGQAAGLSLYGPAATGQNYHDAWINSGTGWSLVQASGSNPAMEFGAKITGTAVPEPSIIAMGVMGACGFLARRRKN